MTKMLLEFDSLETGFSYSSVFQNSRQSYNPLSKEVISIMSNISTYFLLKKMLVYNAIGRSIAWSSVILKKCKSLPCFNHAIGP